MNKINVSEFKATCLGLLERIRQTGEPLEVLKNGKPLAVIYPATRKSKKKSFGSMKATLTGAAKDLIAPVDEENWETLNL